MGSCATWKPWRQPGPTRVLHESRIPPHGIAEDSHWWLLIDETPAAFLHTLRYLSRDEYAFVLCDIEVRKTFRGRGLTRSLVATAERATGHTLHTSGGFTPFGAPALGWLPVVPGETPGVKFGDMGFVADWDNMYAANPL